MSKKDSQDWEREDHGEERRKVEVVMRLFRGESMDGVSRENGVTVSTLTKWREDFIAGGIAGLEKRVFEEARIAQLEKKIGQQAMELELLKKKRIGSRGEA